MILNFNLPDGTVIRKNYDLIPRKGDSIIFNCNVLYIYEISWHLEKDICYVYCNEKDY